MAWTSKVANIIKGKVASMAVNAIGNKIASNFASSGQTSKVAAKSNCPVIISGGVSSIDDIKKAKGLKNIEGIIVGKAIYDGDIKLDELIKEDA